VSEKKSLIEAALAFPSRNMENPPEPSGQASALVREALKDINGTMHQVFFGQQTGPGEPGTPLVPTQAMVTQDLGTVGKYQELMDGFSTKGPTASLHDRERDMDKGIDR